MMRHTISLLLFFLVHSLVFAQADYPNLNEITNRLKALDKNSNATLSTLTTTRGGNPIYALKLGTGDLENKPAIAVMGGVEGYHVLSTELALQFAERLIQNHPEALEHTTFLVFPNMSPEAYEQYHAKLKYERRGNSSNLDHDRDGFLNEDLVHF